MFDHVYAEPHAVLDAEREEYLAYRAGFADESREAHA
jgi:2-oxoisovalerate dehydrogenase E1 component alpha subunit